jgi:hypothetical protein
MAVRLLSVRASHRLLLGQYVYDFQRKSTDNSKDDKMMTITRNLTYITFHT